MKAELVAEYLSQLRLKTGLTYESIAEKSDRSVSTVKKLCNGQTEDPRLDTVAPIVYAMGGSIDEMYNPEKNKDEIKETSLLALKDVYEFQIASMKETNEAHISNIRAHYGQNIEELKENHVKIEEHYEKRLENKDEQIKKLEKSDFNKTIIIGVLVSIFVILFIMEIMHPEHGWLRY